ncbi:MAG: DUF4124 domain-containing protein [Sedimenticola sp.]|nr:DUF4124 domain-containing protein [Sedimenticola sp.]
MAVKDATGWILLGLCMVLPQGSGAAVYRWVDEHGRVQFGDRPPAREEVERIELRTPPPAPESNPDLTREQRREVQQKMLDAYRDEREQRQQRREQRAEEQARRKRACIEARDRLRLYRSTSALYELDDDGNRRYLSDERYEAALAQAREEVSRLCGSRD